MTESYRSMDLGELTAAFEHLGPQAQIFRPVLDVGREPDRVMQAFVGPTETSTDTRLVPVTALPVWDVNGYYRALGIGWPYRPTKKELQRAYLRIGGSRRRYATYALKRLLNRATRLRYDRRPLGEPMDDDYRWEMLRRLAADWAKQQSQVTGRTVTVSDVLGEDLVTRMHAEAEAERQAEEVEALRDIFTDDADSDRPPPVEESYVWPYSFFLWNSRKFDDVTLVTWQQMIVRSCAARSLSFQVAVGYCARTPGAAARMRYLKPEGGHTQILFLHEDVEPTQELADVVVGTYYTVPYDHPLDEPLHLQYPAT